MVKTILKLSKTTLERVSNTVCRSYLFRQPYRQSPLYSLVRLGLYVVLLFFARVVSSSVSYHCDPAKSYFRDLAHTGMVHKTYRMFARQLSKIRNVLLYNSNPEYIQLVYK